MGNVLQAGEGQAPTRQALLGAGGSCTVNVFYPQISILTVIDQLHIYVLAKVPTKTGLLSLSSLKLTDCFCTHF